MHIRNAGLEENVCPAAEAEGPLSTLYSESAVVDAGEVIRLHGDIVFTRETNCKLARAKLR